MADVLNPDALHHGLTQLDGWVGTKGGIEKAYYFDDEGQARAFIQRVSTLADRANHHPDVTQDGATVRLFLVTHSEGGVTQKDLDLATAIDSGEAHGDANADNLSAGPERD